MKWNCELKHWNFRGWKVPNSRFALHGRRPSLIHGLCAFFASNSRFMRLFQAALDTRLDSPFFASLSVHGLHFTVYASSILPSLMSFYRPLSHRPPPWDFRWFLIWSNFVLLACFLETCINVGHCPFNQEHRKVFLFFFTLLTFSLDGGNSALVIGV